MQRTKSLKACGVISCAQPFLVKTCLNSHVMASLSASFACSHSWLQRKCVRAGGLFTAWLPDRRGYESARTTDGSFCQMLETHFDLSELDEVL